jgi:hypothetical protein
MVRKRFYANILCGTDDKIHNLENQMLQQTTAKSFKTDEYRYIFFWISNLLTEGYSRKVSCAVNSISTFLYAEIYIFHE